MNKALHYLAPLLLFVGIGAPIHAQTLDPSFAPVETWQSAAVSSTLEQPDGKLLVAGNFTRLNGRPATGLARLNADGTLDEAFTTTVAARSPATKVRRFPNGQLLVTGYDTLALGGRKFNGVAKLNADGTLVAGFDPGAGAGRFKALAAVAIQPDGKVLLGGSFTSFSGSAVSGLVRLNADGSVDQDFLATLGSGFSPGPVLAIVVQADGKIVVGGQFRNVSGFSLANLVRLNANGSVDTGFNPLDAVPVGGFVVALALDPRTDKLLAHGNLPAGGVIRLTSAGQIDPTFTSTVRANSTSFGSPDIDELLTVDAAGGVLLGGSFSSVRSPADRTSPDRAYLLRLLPTGALDPQFLPQPLNDQVRSVQVLASGEVLVGGDFDSSGTLPQAGLLKLSGTTAQAQTAFRPVLDQPGLTESLYQQADGKVLLAGRFREVNGALAGNIVRLRADGSLDATFAPGGTDGRVDQVVGLPDGRILLAGRFTRVAGKSTGPVVRLLASGQLDATFQPPASITNFPARVQVYALVLHTNGTVLVAGFGLNYTGNVGLYRLLTDGSLDQNYAQKLGNPFSNLPLALAVLPDGRHYVGGSIKAFGSTPVAGIVRLNADGTRDETFVPGTSPAITVRHLALQPDNKVLIGGNFYSYNGVVRPNVARLNPDGSVDESFGVSKTGFDPEDRVFDLALQPNGRVLVAGLNRAYGPLHRLNSDGTLDPSFLGLDLYDNAVTTLLAQADGRILTAGFFTQVDGQPQAGLARLIGGAVLRVGASQSAAALEAWPNPVRNQLRLRLDAAAGPQTVVLLNVLGREVYRSSATGVQMQVPVGHLAAGVYLLRVEYADGPVTRRVVVE